MTDKELLELAAKASGFETIRYEHSDDVQSLSIRYGLTEAIWNGEKYWNPLVDDGDAFRLAVKLQMDVTIEDCGAWVNDRITVMDIDRYAATRRAIVLAAARIGEFGES